MEISNSYKTGYKTIVRKELKDPRVECQIFCLNNARRRKDNRHEVKPETFNLKRKVGDPKQVGRYVRFTCESYWGEFNCALHTIEVL